MSESRLFFGNCLEYLKEVKASSVDFICTDLPYGVLNPDSTAGKWDKAISLEPLWKEFLRVAKENAAIVLFGQGMFSAQLIMSMPDHYRYSLVWDKCQASNFLNANKMPLRYHEDILVFYRQTPTYNPQMVDCGKMHKSRGKLENSITNNCYGKRVELQASRTTLRYPKSILTFPRPHHKGMHPTEKPIDLLQWLIRTYTNEGETVLDATMGSGSCGVAAIRENRNFIGIEKDDYWFEVAKEKIETAQHTPQQGVLL